MKVRLNITALLATALLATAGVQVAMLNASRSDSQRLIEAQEEKKRENQAKAMIAAARFGHLDEIKRLLAAKADVDAEINGFPGLTHYHTTPLMIAASRGDLPMVNTLIAAGADVNARAGEGKSTSKFGLAMNSQRAALKEFADGGMTALMFAADRKDLKIVNALIAAGANVNSENWWGKTALDIAIKPEVRHALEAAGAKRGKK
jgi:ankyrin repeat protein